MTDSPAGSSSLRLEIPTLEPDAAFVARLAALAADSAPAVAFPVRATARRGWRITVATAGVAGVVGGGAWLAAAVTGSESPDPSPHHGRHDNLPGRPSDSGSPAARDHDRAHRGATGADPSASVTPDEELGDNGPTDDDQGEQPAPPAASAGASDDDQGGPGDQDDQGTDDQGDDNGGSDQGNADTGTDGTDQGSQDGHDAGDDGTDSGDTDNGGDDGGDTGASGGDDGDAGGGVSGSGDDGSDEPPGGIADGVVAADSQPFGG